MWSKKESSVRRHCNGIKTDPGFRVQTHMEWTVAHCTVIRYDGGWMRPRNQTHLGSLRRSVLENEGGL